VLLAIFICAQIWFIPQLVSAYVFNLTHVRYWIWFADWLVCSFSIVLLWQTFKDICADRHDSARLDGCGAFGIYWHVVLPLVRPTLLIISLLTLMASAADFIAREVENLQGQAILIMTSYSTMIVSSAIMTVPLFAIFFLAKKLLPPSRNSAFQSAEE
jgi:ABC-type glycerol-3-phosphate transport system permease component